MVGITLTVLSAQANFTVIRYYLPFWALPVITLHLFVIEPLAGRGDAPGVRPTWRFDPCRCGS